jgi:dihydrofolate reductase
MTDQRLGLIFARSRNGVIGKNNQLPWHLPEDLAHFKQITSGHPVIMGRKTWDSLPPRFRPLPGRLNIVITRQNHWRAEGAQTAHSLKDALDALLPNQQAWVIGGAEIYQQALPLACRAEVTELDLEVSDGDVFAPEFDKHWQEVGRLTQLASNGIRYHFVTLLNKGN